MNLLSTIPFYQTETTDSYGDIEEREILESLIDVTDEDTDILQILEATGRFVGTKNKEYFSYFNSFLYSKGTVSGTATIAAGASGTVNLTDASRVRVNEVIMFPGNVQGYVTAISTNALTVHAIDAISLSGGEECSFPTNGIEEGGSGSARKDYPLTRQKNQIQIYETSDTWTDLAMAGHTVIQLANGKKAYFYKGESELYRKHRMDIANSFIVGKFANVPLNSKTVPLTRGLDSYVVDEGGVSDTSAANDVMSKADFEGFCRLLDIARSPKKGFLWCGAEINNKIDNLFDTILDQGAIDYSVFGKGNGKEKAVELGVNSFTFYGRTFYKSALSCLDHPQVTNTADAYWPNLAYYIPTEKIKGTDGKMVDRIRGRYLEMAGNNVNSRWHVKELGGLANKPTNRDNELELSVTSWEGLQITGSQHLGRFRLTRS